MRFEDFRWIAARLFSLIYGGFINGQFGAIEFWICGCEEEAATTHPEIQKRLPAHTHTALSYMETQMTK